MTLREDQSRFTRMVALLIRFAEDHGYELTFGDAWAFDFRPFLKLIKPFVSEKIYKRLLTRLHKKGSFHYKRLAIDMNLFREGTYLSSTESHRPLGEYWQSIGGTWGGAWGDGNHYAYKEG